MRALLCTPDLAAVIPSTRAGLSGEGGGGERGKERAGKERGRDERGAAEGREEKAVCA